MNKIIRFVVWICKKFTRDEIEKIIAELVIVIENKNSEIKFKDDFKQKHPNYRNFQIDPLLPLTESPKKHKKEYLNFKLILDEYFNKYGKILRPIKTRNKSNLPPAHLSCPFCSAPHNYIYFNNGVKKSQLKCKICNSTFHIEKRYTSKSKYFCPYCNYALFTWKQNKYVTIYKCGNKKCPHRLRQLNKLNRNEKTVRKKKSSQFKLTYQFREYYFKPKELNIPSPIKPKVDISNIHNSINTFALVLTFHISYAITARKTAHILSHVFDIKISYQTVLNYAETAAYYCHQFNLQNKGSVDDFIAGDETYIKIRSKFHYAFLFISAKSLKISSYLIADNRGTLPAVQSIRESLRTSKPKQAISFVTDGNPSYQAALVYLKSKQQKDYFDNISLHNVIGLMDLDEQSRQYRKYKQIIERFNRTFKYHMQPVNSFASFNGAFCKTVLVVTHYNFIREHSSLGFRTPIVLSQIKDIHLTQGKWAWIIASVT